MMRTFITTLVLFITSISYGQKCFCANDTILKDIIDCKKIAFDNNSSLYWSYNCDSSWLTFESPTRQKTVLFSLGDGLQDLTGRLGYIYAQEYKNAFLIQCNVISGCCTPPEFYLFDKTTGRMRDSLGSIIFYSSNKKLPLILSLTNDYDFISIYNIDNKKKYFLKLEKGSIRKAVKKTEQTDPELLFDQPIIKGSTVHLTYLLDKPKNDKSRQTKTIVIDMNKYSR